MGIGDEIMVTGEVRRMKAARVAIVNGSRVHRWHPMWQGNPRIARPGEGYDATLVNAPGERPYIEGKMLRRWHWKAYGPPKGELFLTGDERRVGRLSEETVIIQPFIKDAASPNKRWPLDEWQALVLRNQNINWLQIGDGRDPQLRGVRFLRTPDFRAALGAISGARAVVCHEGAVHHAAAALNVPAVVIFGGFISPRVTGYPEQASLYVESQLHPLGCGARVPCFHCHRAMHMITVQQVEDALKEKLA